MKLHCNPISPYARKAMILHRLKGLNFEEVGVTTDVLRGYTEGVNPLGKIPTLALHDGNFVLFDSSVICEFIDSLKSPLLPSSGETRWRQKRLHALGDGISDAVYNYRYETVRPAEMHWPQIISRHTKALEMSVDALASEIDSLGNPWTYGNVSVICALDYMSFRAPHIEWQKHKPELKNWHNQFTSLSTYRDTFAYDSV